MASKKPLKVSVSLFQKKIKFGDAPINFKQKKPGTDAGHLFTFRWHGRTDSTNAVRRKLRR